MTFPSKLPANRAAILLYLVGIFFFALNDALGKWLVTDYTAAQILLLRSVGGLLVVTPIFLRERRLPVVPGQTGLHVLRVLCMAGDSFSFYFATKFLPLADVMTFYMAGPVMVTALSVPLLGERVGLFRWTAVTVGFIGVLVALRPTDASFSGPALIALFGALMFSLGIITTRKLNQTSLLTLVTWQFIGSGIIGAAASPFGWVTPGWVDTGLILIVGIVSMACFACIARSLALAPASVVAPFQYTAILWAMILGCLIWGDVPTPPILAGNIIIVASGIAIFWRERHNRTLPEPREPVAAVSADLGITVPPAT